MMLAIIFLASSSIVLGCGAAVSRALPHLRGPLRPAGMMKGALLAFGAAMLLMAAFGSYLLWLARMTRMPFERMLIDPPASIVVAIFGWFVSFFMAGAVLAHALKRR